MSDDASTAYICIYCPFNSDNLQSLEIHLTKEHGYGNQDLIPSQSSPNHSFKLNKRGIDDDQQSQTSSDVLETNPISIKRAKRNSSPHESFDEHRTSDDDQQSADERDSSSEKKTIFSSKNLSKSERNFATIDQVIDNENDQQKNDFSDSNRFKSLEQLNVNIIDHHSLLNQDFRPTKDDQIEQFSSEFDESLNSTTSCPYCDFKTNDIEQFKSHFIAHIRDKNYRCLLCNRLYKYRGDCSFHIRRKHHRYSQHFNDYIQRFVFDTADGDESITTQIGSSNSMINGSSNNSNMNREAEEPARYFGCPYCDYTSNYGGDVRKHQARKHPNLESKVVKIIRQEVDQFQQERQINIDEQQIKDDRINDDDDDNDNDQQQTLKTNQKKKSTKNNEKLVISPYTTQLPVLPNFAPVRVFQCSVCHQQGTYKWVVERHIRAKHPEQSTAHVIELPAELSVKLQKITSPLKRFRCSLCSLQSKHSWVVMRHIKHFHTLQTASIVDIQPNGNGIDESEIPSLNVNPSNKSNLDDSDSSSSHESSREEIEDDFNDISSNRNNQESKGQFYKCSLCEFQSVHSWTVQKHINEKHFEHHTAFVLTQFKQGKITIDESINQKNKNFKQKNSNGQTRSLSPASALAKAKFSPVVEEALLSLQGSKLNRHFYSVQPKFGIKRLKCRHCFYRSNWKTDMIRHVRIRHNINEPDHHRDMIVMSEQEARSTIESYENTFGKELRRRTFRTWNDWSKAEQEFTPKDGSLQYVDAESDKTQTKIISNSPMKKNIRSSDTKTGIIYDETKKIMKNNIKKESNLTVNKFEKTNIVKTESNMMKQSSNIVSNIFKSNSNEILSDNQPLDLSLKPSNNETNQRFNIEKCQNENPRENEEDDDDDDEHQEETIKNSSLHYLCSVCPYKRRAWPLMERHLSIHSNGQGFVCSICSYTTINESSLIRHMTKIHPTSQLPQVFIKSSRTLNATFIEQHQCSLCSYCCDRSEVLHNHLQTKHPDQYRIDGHEDQNDDDDDDEEEEFDIDSSDDEIDPSNSIQKNLYECPACSPTCETNNSNDLEQLTIHVITQHHNQSCPFCSFTVNNNSQKSLIQHVRLHFSGTLIQPDPILGLEQVKELLMLE